ncbi:DNA replication/repair protein RecF [Pseudactinotalea sp. Z1748]|uniref:DNA replication/repair protein RecF n=1 Tax=Pseudactinotalea sp. Z1748 TaxID=3413027 RepID=UPI003C7C380B
MYVSDLALTDFRSYSQVVLSLEEGITALVGSNGQGKTNVIESLGYLATFSSHRVAGDQALVRAGAERAVVAAKIVRDTRPRVLELEIVSGKANRGRINRSPVQRVRELLGHLRTVLFAPEDLALVKGDPDGRRRFLDDLLIQRDPKVAAVRSDYDRVIRQRNALLKSAGAARRSGGGGDLRTLDVWDEKAAAGGAALVSARVRAIRDLREHVARAYDNVSGGAGPAVIGYRSSLVEHSPDQAQPATDDGDAEAELTDTTLVQARLVEAMSRLRTREIERGVSLVGPHRDDLTLAIGGLPAKGYASHGESWSLALALRLACYELLRTEDTFEADGEPVLILDDVFAELDTGRRSRLAGMVAGAQQVLITAAVAGDIPEELAGARVDVADGTLTRVR